MQDNLLNYTGLTQYDGKIKEYIGDSAGTKIISVTQAQYDALTQAQKESGTYFITDANGGTYSADNCTYDNTDSELDATNVQDAIDEVEDDKLDKNGGDSATCVTAFTSSDVADDSATSWTTVSTLATGETHTSIFSKISQMFKNIRYLYKLLGTTDISTIGNGTITGAISTHNDDLLAHHKIVNCSTTRDTIAKVVTLSGFKLTTGARIVVRFTDTGSSNPASGNLSLNVNSTGAKNIVDAHTNKTVLTYLYGTHFYNNQVHEFVYDGTYWVWLTRDNNTTYTGASLKTNAAKTGSGSTVTTTIAASTTMDNAIGTLLNNDYALNTRYQGIPNLSSSNKIRVANESNQCYIDILNSSNSGFRFGFSSSGIWFQKMTSGSPGDYYWNNH